MHERASTTEPAGGDRLSPERFADLLEGARPTLRLVAAAEAGRQHADDVVQQAGEIALCRLDSFTPGTNFGAWMAAIVRGAARNHRRREHTRRRRESTPRLLPRKDAAAPRADHVWEAIETLSAQQRECLLLRVVGELRYDQIAAVLDIPTATARSHVHRGRLRMMEAVGTAGANTNGGEPRGGRTA